MRTGRGRTIAAFAAAAAALAALLAGAAPAVGDSAVDHRTVCFPTEDGGIVFALLAGQGRHGVVLAHGGGLTKESWQNQAPILVRASDFRPTMLLGVVVGVYRKL